MFLEFLAAENLKTRFPPRSVAGWGIGPPIPSGNRVVGVFSWASGPAIPSRNRVFGVFSCRKPQKHDSRPALSRDGASGPANSERESSFWNF